MTDKPIKPFPYHLPYHVPIDETLMKQANNDLQERFYEMIKQQHAISLKADEYGRWYAALTNQQRAEIKEVQEIVDQYTDQPKKEQT